jgi:general secretion pathway protein E
MRTNTDKAFSPESVCRILLGTGIISADQKDEILKKRGALQKKLERRRGASPSSIVRVAGPVTIIDVIAALKMARYDDPEKELDEDTICQVLANEWGIPYKKIDPLDLDLNLVTTTIPHTFALEHLALPISVKDGCLIVATANPLNVEVLEDISRVTRMKVEPVFSSKPDIVKVLHEFFGFKRSIVAAESEFGRASVDIGNLEQYVRLTAADELPSNDQHIVNAVNHILSYAFDQRASDIHIEPKRDVSSVRMRVDGVLHKVYDLPKKVHSAIVSRIKSLSRLDISEKRRPQDGRVKTDKGGIETEIRVSTVPVAFGEKVVMRIMDPEVLFQDLGSLGFTGGDLETYRRFIEMPHGMVIVCGPTGSGKSTTLYSTLRRLSTPGINITTVEDPVEMVHDEFNQIGVQPAVGVTFASILKNILRQDPDIIMIGEMRDLETAENAIQAALTGHLVLSTLHTNDALSAITRLLDLGIPPYLIRATLIGVVAQRLVRKICVYCKESFEIRGEELASMGLDTGRKGTITLFRGRGCLRCRGTGYLGRTGIYEVLPVTERIRRLTQAEPDTDRLLTAALEAGMVTLRQNAVMKLLEGITTYEEILRVTWKQV